MSFPRYPEYKDSGVEWLGTVPVHWDLVPLKQVITRIESGTSVNAIDTPAGDGELGVLKTSCVYHGHFDADENKAVIPDEYDRVACPVTAGTLVVSRMNTPDLVGAAGVVHVSHENLFLPDRLWQVHFDGADPNFVHHWTHTPAYRAQVEMACAGTSSSMQNLGQDQFRCFVIPRPSYSEQTAIATFLDRETSKIDALVAEQEKLIALLQEKRQAVISHAVTKGLDPNVPMKDSGVEWLREVPEHWEVGAIKRFFSSLDGRRVPLSAEERSVRQGDFPYYGASGVIDSIDAYIFEEDLVLVSEDGANLLSRATPIAFIATGRYWVNNHAHILKPIDTNVRFWAERIEALELAPVITGSAQPKLTIEALMNLVIAAPPTEEERASIGFYIQMESKKLDSLLSEARTAITLLQERRTALISAAVTGQIDVRGITSPEAA